MMPDNKKKLDTCGCCGKEQEEPAINNRPGLPALNYRIGDYARFLARMISNIPGQTVPMESASGEVSRPLSYLTTRATDDPSVALMDAWAVTLDVLTFYGERIANEGFLRTATERRSVLELARSVGYELKPGVAASTHLAFIVEDRDDPYRVTTVPKGTPVMSIPGKGELPQIFETIEDIEARAEWNKLRPRMSLAQNLALGSDAFSSPPQAKLYLIDVDSAFHYGNASNIAINSNNQSEFYFVTDALQSKVNTAIDNKRSVIAIEVQDIYLKGIDVNLKAGGFILIVGKSVSGTVKAKPFLIRDVHLDTKQEITKVTIEGPSEGISLPERSFNKQALPEAKPQTERMGFKKEAVEASLIGAKWTQSNLEVMMKMNEWEGKKVKETLKAKPEEPKQEVKLGKAETGVFALRQKVGMFGHNAPLYCSVATPQGVNKQQIYPVNWDNLLNTSCSPPTAREAISIWKSPNVSNAPFYSDVSSHDVYLERDVSGILANSWVVFDSAAVGQPLVYRVGQAYETSMTGFTLSAKTTGLKLSPVDSKSISPNKREEFKVRETSAYVQSEALSIADLPLEDDILEETKELMLDELVLDLKVGQTVVVSGERQDAPGVKVSEIQTLKEITHYGGYTVLEFDDGLKYGYIRKTVAINANVAEATHGETVEEVLGSGDSSMANKSFILRKPPLTYVKASTPSGAESTLTVRVNGVKWKEIASLYDSNAEEQSYIVRISNDAVPSLTFGNGLKGARLPTGNLNVSAVYRSGIGVKGEVEAGSLTLLKKRPPGVASVTNPQAASGAEDPESLDSARINAPQTVRTLGRIVSLRDYEDFANTFAGVGKAQAVAIWTGESYIVHVTVASSSGKEIDESNPLYEKLKKAISLLRDPATEFKLESFKQRYFNLSVNVKIDDRFIADDVKARIRSSLNEAFSFKKRSFGQPVTAAEITVLIQGVEGVIYVDIDHLYIVTEKEAGASFSTVLPCAIARWEDKNDKNAAVQKAELLLINPAGITLSESTK